MCPRVPISNVRVRLVVSIAYCRESTRYHDTLEEPMGYVFMADFRGLCKVTNLWREPRTETIAKTCIGKHYPHCSYTGLSTNPIALKHYLSLHQRMLNTFESLTDKVGTPQSLGQLFIKQAGNKNNLFSERWISLSRRGR